MKKSICNTKLQLTSDNLRNCHISMLSFLKLFTYNFFNKNARTRSQIPFWIVFNIQGVIGVSPPSLSTWNFPVPLIIQKKCFGEKLLDSKGAIFWLSIYLSMSFFVEISRSLMFFSNETTHFHCHNVVAHKKTNSTTLNMMNFRWPWEENNLKIRSTLCREKQWQ